MADNWIINKSDRILITGAGGFVGTKVFETLLANGFKDIVCLIRATRNLDNMQKRASEADARITFLQGNLLSSEDCAQAVKGVSVIYHLAAGVGKSFPDCFLNSVVTTRNLLDAAIQNSTLKRFVNTSSIAVYTNEKIPRRGLLDETCNVDTRLVERAEAYTYGKAKQDELVLDYITKHNLPCVIIRPGVVFGPGKVKISDRIARDIGVVFLHLGLGNTIPLTFLDNCAEAIVLAGLRPGIDGEVFNITDDNLPTSRQFLRQYKKQVRNITSIPVPYWMWLIFNSLWANYSRWSKGQLPPVFNPASCAIYWKGNTYSNKKAKEHLGWSPKVEMAESLKIFFTYMKTKQNDKNS